MITRQEEIEGQLIRITSEMGRVALYPLTRENGEELVALAAKVTELVEELTEVAGAS